jgi:hypothetical protein
MILTKKNCIYSITLISLLSLILLQNTCKNRNKQYVNIKNYLETIHDIKVDSYCKLFVIFANNYECSECDSERITVFEEIISNAKLKDPNYTFVIHYLKAHPSANYFSNFENVTVITGDKLSVFEYGILMDNDRGFVFEDGIINNIQIIN